MTLKPETQAHLNLAGEFREQARRLLEVAQPPLRLITTAAFESATHLIQALLLERHGVRITSHPQRQREIDASASLSPISGNYRRLYDISRRATNNPSYVLTDQRVRSLLDTDLPAIEQRVREVLELDPISRSD